MSDEFNPYQAPETDIKEPRDETAPRPWYAVSLIEVLVVLFILAVFISLLLPAVSHSRHSRRRHRDWDDGPRPVPRADGR